MKRKLLTTVGALVMLGMTTHVGMAGQMTSTMNATITIISGCTVNAKDINFGTWANLKSPRTQTSTVDVACNVAGGSTDPVIQNQYTVKLSPGKSGNQASRQMIDTANNKINYNIYTQPNYTGIFGDGTASTATLKGNIAVDTDDTYVIYAKTDATTTNPTPGTYTDVLTLTVDY